MSILFYKRPDYVSKEGGPMTATSCQRYAEKGAGKSSIPSSLSFEKVIENKTMPPCSLQDFLDYLVYVAHDAENLQFYLWLKDYKKRFAKLPASERNLSPAWDSQNVAPDLRRPGNSSLKSTESELLDRDLEAMYLSNLEKIASKNKSSPPAPPQKDYELDENFSVSSPGLSSIMPFEASRRWQQSTSQPFRKEINQIITHYLLPSSPRELNLSHKARASILSALHRTTHPSALEPVEQLCLLTLRHQSHPNFVRWSLCNGNKPRVFLLRSLAVSWLLMFSVGAVLLILSSKTRWARIGLAPLLWVGVTNLIAAAKGLCILLHRLHTRELRPWEYDSPSEKTTKGSFKSSTIDKEADRFAEELAMGATGAGDKPSALVLDDTASQNSLSTLIHSTSSPTTLTSSPKKSFNPEANLDSSSPPSSRPSQEIQRIDIEAYPTAPQKSLALRLTPLGPRNSFEDEAWVQRWERMGWWARVRVRKVWMKEEGLRLMQNRIVVQAELWALIVTIVVVTGVVAAPEVGLF